MGLLLVVLFDLGRDVMSEEKREEKRGLGNRRPSLRGAVQFMSGLMPGKKDEKSSANSTHIDPSTTTAASQQQSVLSGQGGLDDSDHPSHSNGSNGKEGPPPIVPKASQQQSVPSGQNSLDDSDHTSRSNGSNRKASSIPTPGSREKRFLNYSRLQALVASMREKVSQGGNLETQESEELTNLSNEILGGFVDAKKPRYTQRVEIKGKLKDALTSHLTGSTDALKAKLVNGAHKDKISKVHGLILDKFEPLAKEASEKKLKEFTSWFDGMLEDHKDAFPEDNKVWHEIVKPALMALLGVIVTLVTAVARPFVTGVADYANSFFVKPDTAGFKAFKEDATQLRGKLEEEVTTSVAALGA